MSSEYDWGPYWTRIWYAADAMRRRDIKLTSAGVLGTTVSGTLIGTAIAPGLGTIIGGSVGFLMSAFGALAFSEAQRSKNYWFVLDMSSKSGKAYAKELYYYHEKFLTSTELKILMRRQWRLMNLT